jgi:LPPG:FO 2-phospho-L-lactate transferase
VGVAGETPPHGAGEPGGGGEPGGAAGAAGEVVVLAGGTGGAKLARGMLDIVDPGRLTVIANTGDDILIHGAYVSPDPDLVTFWLADLIDERGWGLRGDTFKVMDGLRELGIEVWFNLGDRDLAWCLKRREMLGEEFRPTDALSFLGERIGLRARVLPMCDQQVSTEVRTESRWWNFQEFMILERGAGTITDLEFHGIEDAAPSREVLAAIERAEAIVIGPSNPLASIGPILAVPGLRDALARVHAPVVAVSPIVGGGVLKGPTASFMAFAGLDLSARGIAEFYGDLLDGIVTDEPPLEDLPTLRIDTAMPDPAARARVAEQILAFADSLAG